MSDETADQPTASIAVVNGMTCSLNATTLKTISPTGSVYTFLHSFTHAVNKNQTMTYRKGVAYSLSPDVKAILLAAGAPMVAA